MKSRNRFLIGACLSIGLITPEVLAQNRRQDPAGHETGSGGDGLIVGRNLYLLDLVEAGVQRNPYYDPSIVPANEYTERLQAKFQPVFEQDETHAFHLDIQKLSHKLTEIHRKASPLLARYLMGAIEQFTWQIVSQELVDVPDEDSVLSYPVGTLKQIAIRRNSIVRLGQGALSRLNADHTAATVLHEMFYAILPLLCTGGGTSTAPSSTPRVCRQVSSNARDLNGLLFSRFDPTVFRRLASIAGLEFFQGSAAAHRSGAINYAPRVILTDSQYYRENPSLETLQGETSIQFITSVCSHSTTSLTFQEGLLGQVWAPRSDPASLGQVTLSRQGLESTDMLAPIIPFELLARLVAGERSVCMTEVSRLLNAYLAPIRERYELR